MIWLNFACDDVVQCSYFSVIITSKSNCVTLIHHTHTSVVYTIVLLQLVFFKYDFFRVSREERRFFIICIFLSGMILFRHSTNCLHRVFLSIHLFFRFNVIRGVQCQTTGN